MQEIIKIDENNIIKSFNKEDIIILKDIVDEYVLTSNGITNKKYFTELGNYTSRNDDCINIDLSNYFNRLLYAPNFAILDYIIKNKNILQDLKFIDNGAGLGILSYFLKLLNIDCYNYDNFNQIENVTIDQNILNKTGIKIKPITNIIPDDSQVLVCSGIWVDNPQFLKLDLQYLLLDRNHLNKGIGNELISNFKLLEEYNTICVYGK